MATEIAFQVHSMQRDVFNFGSQKGKHINQVDDGYLEWIINTFSVSHPWRKAGADCLTRQGEMKQQQSANRNVHDLLRELNSCTRKIDLQKGRRVHANAVENGTVSNLYVAATLINMYAKCGSMVEARTVFDTLQEPHVASWNALILGYASNRQGLVALDMFSRMKDERRCAPNSVTYVGALKSCTSLAADGKGGCLERGRAIHLEIGDHMDHFLQNTLIDMYAKYGSMEEARTVFDSVQEPDVVSWSTLILGYAECAQGLVALDMFSRMKDEGRSAPNSVTYLAALKACTLLAAEGDEAGKRRWLECGREIHAEIGQHMNAFVESTVIDMYAKCGNMEEARTVFKSIQEPNVVSWTALILGYADNGQALVALDLFTRMRSERRCAPNSVTYVAALKACTLLAADGDEAVQRRSRNWGIKIHSEVGGHMDLFVQSALIDMYAKCGTMVEARTVFDSIKDPDVVSWNALIMGYADSGEGLVALDLFSRMQHEHRSVPSSVTYVAALKACGSTGALAIGRRFHSEIGEFNVHVVTCLVDFYAKCGSMQEAHEAFDLHSRLRGVSTWNALLAGYSSFGDTGSVFNLFEAMQDQGFRADAVTFLCMLSCCSHAGLLEKAWEYFEAMPVQYGVTHTVKHYTCMIDLLGRANKLEEAVALLQKMPCFPDAVTWTTLLGACRKWKNAEIGRLAFKSLLDLDMELGSAYELMAEIYGSRGMWDKQKRVLETRVKSGCPRKLML